MSLSEQTFEKLETAIKELIYRNDSLDDFLKSIPEAINYAFEDAKKSLMYEYKRFSMDV